MIMKPGGSNLNLKKIHLALEEIMMVLRGFVAWLLDF